MVKGVLIAAALVAGLSGSAAAFYRGVGQSLGGAYPATTKHYTPGANFDGSGNYLPGVDGFNMADIENAGELSDLPAGVTGLVFLGLCNGADAGFISAVTPFEGQPNVYGFYLMDEPDPTGLYGTQCLPSNLKAESDYIHTNISGAKTFIVMMNLGTFSSPTFIQGSEASFTGTISGGTTLIVSGVTGTIGPLPVQLAGTGVVSGQTIVSGSAPTYTLGISQTSIGPESMSSSYPYYTPADTDVDYFGIDPYPCQMAASPGPCEYSVIGATVTAVEANGVTIAEMVPIYQAFGGGGYAQWFVPTYAELAEILSTWQSLVPNPSWDYAYAWGSQLGDSAISTVGELQQVFITKNSGS